MLSSPTVGFQRPDNSNLANLTPGLCSSSWSWHNSRGGGGNKLIWKAIIKEKGEERMNREIQQKNMKKLRFLRGAQYVKK